MNGSTPGGKPDHPTPIFEASATSPQGREVMIADDKRYSAMLSQDWPTLRALLHEDLVYTHSNGDRDGRDSYLKMVKSGLPIYLGVDMKERFVAAWDDVAVLHGRVAIRVEVRGTEKQIDLLFQSVWVPVEQSWQMLGWSSTKVNVAA